MSEYTLFYKYEAVMSIPPLADTLRPTHLTQVAGQSHLIGDEGLLTKLIQQKHPISILLWGPPGSGKTTIARLYAQAFNRRLLIFSAVKDSISDIKKTLLEVKSQPLLNTSPLLFIDEIHRFNKAQQDLFLPYIEDGTITFIGATTENPSFALNAPLLSRLHTLTLKRLDSNALGKILERFKTYTQKIELSSESEQLLIEMAGGDGRYLLNILESLLLVHTGKVEKKDLLNSSLARLPSYDKQGDNHFGFISALHKSVRTSDVDGSLYWLSRLLLGGEDPNYILRRLCRIAAEDIGLADPDALKQVLSAWDGYNKLGSPEGELLIAQATIYLACAPKSNAAYVAYKKARAIAEKTHHLPPPKHFINAPTTWMKKEGFGEGYQYDHDADYGVSSQLTFPDGCPKQEFYKPVPRGFEREMQKRLEFFKAVKS